MRLVLTVVSPVFADSAADVAPLPFNDFSRIAAERDVSIDATSKAAILDFADGLDPVPPEFMTVVETLRADKNSASLKSLVPLLTHKDGQAVCTTIKGHSDPVVRFIAGVVLSGSGNSDAAKAVHALLHDESISLTDKRLLRTWCDGIGLRAASDDADKILAHLTAAMSKEPKLKKGDVAPDFDANTVTGRKISSEGLKGKLIVLHFWATSCGACLVQMSSHIERLSKYDADAVEIIFVSLDDDEKTFESTVKKYRMPFNNVRDPRGWGGELARAFGVNSMPFDIIIGREGKVISNSIDDISAALKSAP